MAGTHSNETVVEKRHGWLRIVTILTASLTIPGAIVASVLAFQRDLLLGLVISSIGLLVACSIVGMYHLTRLFFSIEENTRRAKAMAPYTMQMTHSITATQNVMQELTTTMQGIATQMNTVAQDLHEATEKMNAVARYSRTTAVLLHQQGKLEQAQHIANGNGSETPVEEPLPTAAPPLEQEPATAAPSDEPVTDDAPSDEPAVVPPKQGEEEEIAGPDPMLHVAADTEPPEVELACREVNDSHEEEVEQHASPEQEPVSRPRRFNLKRLSQTEHI